MSEPMNEYLRAHVTRVGFDLSMGKSHVAALVYIDHVRLAKWDASSVNTRGIPGPLGRAYAHFATGARGLQERGLVIHTPPKTSTSSRSITDADGTWHFFWEPKTFRITKAGRLVIGLLKEAGIYDEYAALLDIREPSASEAAS